jgi:hypothetical protein
MYGHEAYFCRTAKTQLQQVSEDSVVLKKAFLLDSVSRKTIHNVRFNNGLYMLFQRAFQKGYLSQQKARPVFDWMMHVRSVLGVETEFVEVPSKGEVAFTYCCFPDRINVHVDFSNVDRADCTDILVLNEQGAKHFPLYLDSEGTRLFGRQVGAWAKVAAEEATFTNPDSGWSFSLENLNGAALIRGREHIKNRFSWSGLTYALNPQAVEYGYTIRLSQTSL